MPAIPCRLCRYSARRGAKASIRFCFLAGWRRRFATANAKRFDINDDCVNLIKSTCELRNKIEFDLMRPGRALNHGGRGGEAAAEGRVSAVNCDDAVTPDP